MDCGDAGLSSAEAAGRLNRHELNRLTPPKPRSVLMRFLAQFNNALIYVLLVAAGIRAGCEWKKGMKEAPFC